MRNREMSGGSFCKGESRVQLASVQCPAGGEERNGAGLVRGDYFLLAVALHCGGSAVVPVANNCGWSNILLIMVLFVIHSSILLLFSEEYIKEGF